VYTECARIWNPIHTDAAVAKAAGLPAINVAPNQGKLLMLLVRAIGARGSTLTALAVRQTLAIAVLGLLAGGVLYVVGRALITAWRPQFSVVLTPGGLARAVAAALLMGLVAAVVPARRLVATDPASAYRGG